MANDKLTEAITATKMSTLGDQIHRSTQTLKHEASWSQASDEVTAAIYELERKASELSMRLQDHQRMATRQAYQDAE